MKAFRVLVSIAAVLLWTSICSAGAPYFISKNGDNSHTGLSWAQAWLTVNHADSTLSSHGDTIVIGAGIWYNTQIRVPTGGSATNWQVYCCSSYYEYMRGAISYDQAVSGKYSAGAYKTWITSASRYTGWSFYALNGSDTIWQHASTDSKTYGPFGSWAPTALSQGWAADAADTQFQQQQTLAAVNSRGKCFQSGGTVYIIPYGAQNPNQASITIMVSGLPTVGYCARSGSLTSYVKFWGLRITHGNGGAMMFDNDDWQASQGTCSTFTEHCFLEFGAYGATLNPGVVFFTSSQSTDTMQFHRWPIFRNDSIGWANMTGGSPTSPTTGNSGGGIVAYDWWHGRVDSCQFFGNPISGNMIRGVHLKNDDHGNQSLRDFHDNQVTNCYFKNMKGCAVQVDMYPTDDSIYGNICVGGRYFFYGDVGLGGTRPTSLWLFREIIAHNTVYGGSDCAFSWYDEPISNPCSNGGGNKIFGNAISDSFVANLYVQMDYCTNWYQWFTHIDHNKWYNLSPSGQPASPFKLDGGSKSFATWQSTYHFDSNGTYGSSMGFDSVNAANPWLGFKRSNATAETHDTLGGKVFTVIGAVQPTATSSEACPQASLLTPSTATTVTSLPVTVYWSSSDADGDSMNTRLLLDTSNPPTTLKAQDTVSSVEGVKSTVISGLVNNTRYYWRTTAADTIDGRAAADCIDTSVIFYFDTDTTTSPTATRGGILFKPGGPQ